MAEDQRGAAGGWDQVILDFRFFSIERKITNAEFILEALAGSDKRRGVL
jgi:hypothetical protein